MEDFTIEGTIPPEPARIFAEAALLADPVKAVWKHMYQFNNLDPARVHVPTLVVSQFFWGELSLLLVVFAIFVVHSDTHQKTLAHAGCG